MANQPHPTADAIDLFAAVVRGIAAASTHIFAEPAPAANVSKEDEDSAAPNAPGSNDEVSAAEQLQAVTEWLDATTDTDPDAPAAKRLAQWVSTHAAYRADLVDIVRQAQAMVPDDVDSTHLPLAVWQLSAQRDTAQAHLTEALEQLDRCCGDGDTYDEGVEAGTETGTPSEGNTQSAQQTIAAIRLLVPAPFEHIPDVAVAIALLVDDWFELMEADEEPATVGVVVDGFIQGIACRCVRVEEEGAFRPWLVVASDGGMFDLLAVSWAEFSGGAEIVFEPEQVSPM